MVAVGVLGAFGCSSTDGSPAASTSDPLSKDDSATETTFISSPDADKMSKGEIEAAVQKAYEGRTGESTASFAPFCRYVIMGCSDGTPYCYESFYCCGGRIRICWSSPS